MTRSSIYPFQSCKEFSPQFCVVFLMHASSSMLGRSPADCCDQCPFPLLGPVLGPVLAPVLGAVLGPVLGTIIRILKERGPKLKPKLGPKSAPKSGNTFAKLFAHFFGHAANRCPQWSCPCFATFAFFLARAHPCTHSATANSSEARSYRKKNTRKREQAQSVPPAIIVAAAIQTVHVAINRITCKNLTAVYLGGSPSGRRTCVSFRVPRTSPGPGCVPLAARVWL